MEFRELRLKGAYEIILDPHDDERGSFMRFYDDKVFRAGGFDFTWVQENHSRNLKRGTVRGLHFQFPPHLETKLICCVKGKIWDVHVDLRKDSPTFGEWDCLELSDENHKMILIPRGFAHGFCTLSDDSHILYKNDNYYDHDHYSGIHWNSPDLNIKWPFTDVLVSAKDQNLMTFTKFVDLYGGF